jgi:hypothetical protein
MKYTYNRFNIGGSNMNKKLLALVLSGVVVLSGCGASETPKTEEPQEKPAAEETQGSTEETGEMEEVDGHEEASSVENALEIGFLDAVGTRDINIVKAYIDNNYQAADQGFLDAMIIMYDEMLENESYNIAQKYESGQYVEAVMAARDENYKFDINLVEDESMKEELKNVLDSGFTYVNEEGVFYLRVDESKFYYTFKDKMSDNLKMFYDLKDKESKSSTFIEDTINIDVTYDEIKNRALQLEQVMKAGVQYYDDKTIEYMMKSYVDALTRVDQIDGGWNMETGEVNAELVKVYKELKETDAKILSKVASDMINILEPVEYKFDDANEEIKNKIRALKESYSDESNELYNIYK